MEFRGAGSVPEAEGERVRRSWRLLLPAALGWLVGCSGGEPEPPAGERQAQTARAEHVGGSVCAECHAQEYRSWVGSHHDLAMQPATPDTVLGDFDDATFRYAGTTTTFHREGDEFRVRTDGADGALADFKVAYTFGFEPLQQYLIETDGGRLQAFTICWDSRPSADGGQRWFHLSPEEEIGSDNPLHWTGLYQNWNQSCAECHSTGLRKNFDASTRSYATAFDEIDVSCEACHGPGSEHVRLARADRVTGSEGLQVRLKDVDGGEWLLARTGEPTAKRSVPRTSRAQIETCARCHSRRGPLTGEYRHGEPLGQTHRLSLLDEGLYHDDGQILDEVYVHGSFLQSRMYAEGVTCTDCHDPHTARLQLAGNATCVRCHTASVFDTAEHHFHDPAAAGGQCVACHMASRDYMVVDPRRDHSFRIPRPDRTLTIGTPSACTGCHAELGAERLADAAERWWGDLSDGRPDWAEALWAARNWQADGAERLVRAFRDREAPAIARATVVEAMAPYLGVIPPQVVEETLRDSEPLVRRSALGLLQRVPFPYRWELGSPLLSDPLREVRQEAARLLAHAPVEIVPADRRAVLDDAVVEYLASEAFNGDRAEAHVNLGNYRLDRGDAAGAEREYRAAIATGQGFIAAYLNLADLYRATGRESDGEQALHQALAIAPDDAGVQHALGLHQVRQRRYDAGLESLRKGMELAPRIPRYRFVYAVALNDLGRGDEARQLLLAGHEAMPASAEILRGLTFLANAAGDLEGARDWARKLVAAAPNDADALGLARQLGAI